MRKLLFIPLLLTGFLPKVQSLQGLDSLLTSLHNKDLYVAPIIRGVCITAETGKKNKASPCPDLPRFVVSSLDEDIREVASRYSKEIVMQKLVELLQDTTRDFYANALLYDLFENSKLGKLLFMKRDDWVNSGRKLSDTEYWQQYSQRSLYF